MLPPQWSVRSPASTDTPIETTLTKREALFLMTRLRDSYTQVQKLAPITELDGVKNFYDTLFDKLQAVLDA